MICGWAWALKTCPCTSEVSPSLWRPSHTNTSFSLERRSPAPTRSLWTRGRCSLKRPRYLIRIPSQIHPKQAKITPPPVLTWIVCLVCLCPGRRDHKDHESLHQHDREEALQCQVCLQFWEQLDQMMDTAGSQIWWKNHEKQQMWRESAEKRPSSYFQATHSRCPNDVWQAPDLLLAIISYTGHFLSYLKCN